MKTKITTLILLFLGLLSGETSAQTTYQYTDAAGLKWNFSVDAKGARIMGLDMTGPSFVSETGTNLSGNAITWTRYTGDVLRVPSSVSDGTNTYPVYYVYANFSYPNIFEKIILPGTLTEFSGAFFHPSVKRIEVEPGWQFTKLGNLAFAGYSYTFPNQWETALYYDFSNVPLTAGNDTPFYDLPDNTLIFLNAASEAVCQYREQTTPIGDSRRPYNWQDAKYRNTVRGGVCGDLFVTDEECFESPRSFTAEKANYDRVFSNTAGKTVSTLYLPYPTDLPTGMRAYTLTSKGTDINGDKAFMFSPLPDGTRLQANTPYLVQITDGQSHTLPEMHNVTVPATPNVENSAVMASSDGDWKFYGTTLYINNGKAYAKKAYYLNGNKWWQVQSGVANDFIAPFRCFISSPTGAVAAPSFFMVLEDDNTADGIKALETETNTDIKSGKYPFYSVDGKQMGNDYNKLESGQMYIVNGKKFYKI
ncbi:hypothetical protein [Prevotella pallens]|uniref:hypothetical protein n=1 Tax=Prevotella pallens TaxID=60133 RepID=UPI0028D16330|nr:hypothetical protein [Prevotella pallens]